MNQETTTTGTPMQPDPTLGRILALGIKPTLDPPKMIVATPDGMRITMQPDGQIALFDGHGLFACECKGRQVEALPEKAMLKACLRRESQAVSIYQSGIKFYTKRKSKITRLKVLDVRSPYASNAGDDGPDELSDDELNDVCGYFHTDDECIDNDQPPPPLIPAKLPEDD